MIKYFILLLSFFSFYTNFFAQEIVSPISYNNTQSKLSKKKLNKAKNNTNYIFISPPIQLPLEDDFSTNKQIPLFKENLSGYEFFIDNINCIKSQNYISDSFKFNKNNIAKQYQFDCVNQTVDSSILIAMKDIYSPSDDNCEDKSNLNNLYPSYYQYTYDFNLCKVIDSQLIFDTIIYCAKIIEISNKGLYLWEDNFAYINNHFAYLPPSIGVATLDGLNEYGVPYNSNNTNAWGIADYLTSTAIDLNNFDANDSIYLSFMLQAQGFGDYPNDKDSFIVQFLDSSGNWNNVFNVLNTKGNISLGDNMKFNHYFIEIPRVILLGDPFYFHSNFKFRFKNYATISGNNDHWHIDYVRMDKKRSNSDTLINDISFQYDFPSIFKNYSILPYKQFVSTELLNDSILFYNNNNNITNQTLSTYSIKSEDITNNNILYSSPSPTPFVPQYNFEIKFNPKDNLNITFPLTKPTYIKNIAYTTPNGLESNDTCQKIHFLDNEIAYDDGSAEMAYGLEGNGLKKYAIKYVIPKKDTLAAIKILFSSINGYVIDAIFNLAIWKNININSQEEELLKTIELKKPIYIDTLNSFVIFGIDTPIIVEDSFYIGWTQTEERNIQIGYDRNTHNGINNSLIYTDQQWKKSSLTNSGSPMIRAILDGTKDYRNYNGSNSLIIKELESISIYPNPANSIIFIKNLNNNFAYEIYDLNGKNIKTSNSNSNFINIEALEKGIYLLKIITLDRVENIKFIKE